MSSSYVWLRARMRWIRLAIFATTLVAAWVLITRFTIISLALDDASCVPRYHEGSALLVDTWAREKVAMGSQVAFRFKGSDSYRVGRVLAVGGDQLALSDGAESGRPEILRNGLATGIHLRPGDDPSLVPAQVPPGHVFVVNIARISLQPDSRRAGPFPLERILGRVVVEVPW